MALQAELGHRSVDVPRGPRHHGVQHQAERAEPAVVDAVDYGRLGSLGPGARTHSRYSAASALPSSRSRCGGTPTRSSGRGWAEPALRPSAGIDTWLSTTPTTPAEFPQRDRAQQESDPGRSPDQCQCCGEEEQKGDQ
ncbi:hypothetical protein [Streptomyces sp. BE133]|uniref:hypothetical protein n=1 Tax=Streptomyces sp. BE133 TaxID=3002523 RepID=UPI003FA6B7CE